MPTWLYARWERLLEQLDAPALAAVRFLRSFWGPPLLSGVLFYLSFAPVDWGWCMPLGWFVLLLSFRLRDGDRAGRQALVAGVLWFVPGLVWIAPLMVPGWLFVALWCAGWEFVFGWLVGRFHAWAQEGDGYWWIFVVPLLRVLVDLLRTVVLTGFPWLLTGYSGWDSALFLGIYHLMGVHGATLLIVYVASALAESVARRIDASAFSFRPLLPASLLLILVAGISATSAPEERRGPVVALLQGDIPQLLKEDRGDEGGMTQVAWLRRHVELAREGALRATSEERSVDVFVWPETMYPYWLIEGDGPIHRPVDDARNDAEWEAIATIAGGSAASLVGVATRTEAGSTRNSVVAVDRTGEALGVQDKQHLTPFGEYIPLRSWVPFWESIEAWLKESVGFVPDLEAGEGPVPLPIRYDGDDGLRAGVMICYESVYPEVARGLVEAGSDVLVNASNYGWFAGTAQMDQALAIACVRAAEFHRPVVLASNNGVSAVIGPDGRVRSILTSESGATVDFPGVLVAEVPLSRGRTPFLEWGEGLAWCLGLLGLLALPVVRRRAVAVHRLDGVPKSP